MEDVQVLVKALHLPIVFELDICKVPNHVVWHPFKDLHLLNPRPLWLNLQQFILLVLFPLVFLLTFHLFTLNLDP